MDDYEAIQKTWEFNTEVVIIAQTGHALAGDRKKTLAAWRSNYICKPVDSGIFNKVIYNCLLEFNKIYHHGEFTLHHLSNPDHCLGNRFYRVQCRRVHPRTTGNCSYYNNSEAFTGKKGSIENLDLILPGLPEIRPDLWVLRNEPGLAFCKKLWIQWPCFSFIYEMKYR